MDDDASSDLQKCIPESPMDTDEGPLINENSNGLSHLLTEGEFNSVDTGVEDESSTSNQAFLNAVELSAGSVGDYLENNTGGFNTHSFDVGDNAVTFPSESLSNMLSDGDSQSSFKNTTPDADGNCTDSQKAQMESDYENTAENINEASMSDQAEHTEQLKMEDTSCSNADSRANELSNDTNLSTADNIKGENSKDSLKIEEYTKELPVEESEDIKMEVKSETENVSPHSHIESAKKRAIKEYEKFFEESEEIKTKLKSETEVCGSAMGTAVKESEDFGESLDIMTEVKSETKDFESPMETAVKECEEKIGGAEETEVVSEDELPTVQKPSIKDAENVSDDELPGPKPADLPADTEVVSEDELPSSKKDKESRKRKPDEVRDDYDPGSPTSESESCSKKQAVAKNGESKPVPAEKKGSIDEKPKKKALPELEKYWKVVNDDPTDFTGWTYLLQYVDQESDVEAARDAYDAFLSHYPYCYGYWRKYADYEKRKGSKKKCLEVLERGLKAIPLSVDLWIHYLNHIKATRTEDLAYIRSQYERAIDACGLEFRSDRLWESYIKWEAENGTALNVTNIYDRLLATPTLGYTSHFDNFQEHVMSEPVSGVVSHAELVRLRGEVRDAADTQPQLDLPPGEDEPLDHIASEDEAQAIKEQIIAARRKVHKTTGEEVAARWTFEEGIKRPYFHVKPLERCQLKNWKSYLEWEKQHGTFKRSLVLHERCLIACALYEEFWMRLVKFLEERVETQPELINVEREVLERACTVHHLDKPDLHLYWAHFEEELGNATKASEILERIEKTSPNLMQIQYRRVNLERRRGDYEKCSQLYEGYIAASKNKAIGSALSIKYVRFLFHIKRDASAAKKAIDDAIAKDPLNVRLYMQRLDIALHTPGTPYEVLEDLAMSYERQEGAEAECSALMASRRRELAEELGPASAARRAYRHARMLAKHLRKRARKDKHDQPPLPAASTDPSKKKEGTVTTSSATATTANSAYYQTPPAAAQSYDQSYAQPYQPPWGYQQPPGPYQHHPHPWPQYPNYY